MPASGPHLPQDAPGSVRQGERRGGCPRRCPLPILCDVVCDVTALTVSRICRSMPTCADVDTDKVHIVIGQYLCASAAVCGGNLLTSAISILSIRDQEVRRFGPHCKRPESSDPAAIGKVL